MPNDQPLPSPSQATSLAPTTLPRKIVGSAQPMLGELITHISESISTLMYGGIDLTKVKGQRMAKKMRLGAGLLTTAGVLALFIFELVLGVLMTRLSHVIPPWAAFLVVAPVPTLIAIPMALIGIKRLGAAGVDTPTPQEELKESVNAVKGAVTSGLQGGNAR